jgi:hypothetical protein
MKSNKDEKIRPSQEEQEVSFSEVAEVKITKGRALRLAGAALAGSAPDTSARLGRDECTYLFDDTGDPGKGGTQGKLPGEAPGGQDALLEQIAIMRSLETDVYNAGGGDRRWTQKHRYNIWP